MLALIWTLRYLNAHSLLARQHNLKKLRHLYNIWFHHVDPLLSTSNIEHPPRFHLHIDAYGEPLHLAPALFLIPSVVGACWWQYSGKNSIVIEWFQTHRVFYDNDDRHIFDKKVDSEQWHMIIDYFQRNHQIVDLYIRAASNYGFNEGRSKEVTFKF